MEFDRGQPKLTRLPVIHTRQRGALYFSRASSTFFNLEPTSSAALDQQMRTSEPGDERKVIGSPLRSGIRAPYVRIAATVLCPFTEIRRPIACRFYGPSTMRVVFAEKKQTLYATYETK
ncbi:hypothetical protein TSAR_012179 [Trichomalopsis sarcophagae]|uniref:Uncharacterized protein n=1 Tax=Trichomalopsis sarcophagae TaxID=543379 RepID=A0A232EI39_9HYME|nr:hypothetical protein TSAR_012179 [Trichomalopsis sarcophagae]